MGNTTMEVIGQDSMEDVDDQMPVFVLKNGRTGDSNEEFRQRVENFLVVVGQELFAQNGGLHGRHVPPKNLGNEKAFSEGAPHWEGASLLRQIIMLVARSCEDLTAVMEHRHIDRSFRSAHYAYHAKKFSGIGRYSLRLSLFSFLCRDEGEFWAAEENVLTDYYIGSIVVDPVGSGIVGRTLLSPKYLMGDRSFRLRLSEYIVTVFGKRLFVEAFPFRMQDGEAMRCGEVALLNLICYYSNQYPEYGQMLPAEILDLEKEYSHERVTPSRGIEFAVMSKILSRNGFFPRMYALEQIRSPLGQGLPPEVKLERQLRWYLNSGIPVIANLRDGSSNGDGHALVCIGYGEEQIDGYMGFQGYVGELRAGSRQSSQINEETARRYDELLEKSYLVNCMVPDGAVRGSAPNGDADQMKTIDEFPGTRSCILVHDADIPRKYSVIDDGQIPYELRPFEELSRFEGMRCDNLIVPLSRSMYMDAMDAYECFLQIILHETRGILNMDNGILSDGECVFMRMFLTSARTFKRERSLNRRDAMAPLYAHLPMPHFLYVMELYQGNEFMKGEGKRAAFCEIVFDATASGASDVLGKAIISRYPGRFFYRSVTADGREEEYYLEDIEALGRWDELPRERKLIKGFRGNLTSSN